MRRLATIGITLLVLCSEALAQKRPPEAAFRACSGASAGSQCRITTPKGALAGQCRRPPQQSGLVCVPEGGRLKQGARQQAPKSRQHSVIQSDGTINTVPANASPIAMNRISVEISGKSRVLRANGVSEHLTGVFPNRGNPNAIAEQSYVFRVPLRPQITGRISKLTMGDFGLGVNGVPFDPGAAEWYQGNRNSGWQYEALSGAVALGLDDNHAHVQPTGAYHYHGLPRLLLEGLKVVPEKHSPQVGWAADGFPIYALYGYSNGKAGAVAEQTSSYRLKAGHRPSGGSQPGGHYDGTFTADYEYVAGAGSLDECNGRVTVTAEYPQGSYAYFLTNSWPVVPRCFKGTPSTDFLRRR